jgi:Long-chain fatty acid transport protein
MPSMAGKWSVNDRSAIGVSFMARGGMNTDYRTNGFYDSSHTGVDLQQMFLNTTYAYKLAPKHSLGVTGIVAYQRFEAQGLEAFTNFSNDPDCLTNNAHDNSHGFGVKIGYLGEVAPRLNVGLSYSPKISMTKFDSYSGRFSNDGSFDIPADAQLGLAFKATDRTSLLFDVEHIAYSKVDSIGNHLLPNLRRAPLGATGGAGFGWNDMTAYKAGIQWKASPNWTFRGGYSHANQPIPSSDVLFNILAPGVIQDHLTAGFTTPVRGGNFNFALMYALDNTVTGSNPLEAPGAQQIEIKMNEWEAEFSYAFRF